MTQRVLAKFGTDAIRMAHYSNPFWNAGVRFWLEHRGPAIGRALAATDGPILWIAVADKTRMSYLARLGCLMAEHLVVGHAGPMPPHHLGLQLPWTLGNAIPDPPSRTSEEKGPLMVPFIVDAVRRPLPPLASSFLFGDESLPLCEGALSYFPASVIYCPLDNGSWPAPDELLKRSGDMPDMRVQVVNGLQTLSTLSDDQRTNEQQRWRTEADPPIDSPMPPSTVDLVLRRLKAELLPGQEVPKSLETIHDAVARDGFLRYSDPRIYSDFWQVVPNASSWEMSFARELGADFLIDESHPPFQIRSAPVALLDLEIPYLRDVPWEILLQLREDRADALALLRRTIRRACVEITAARGTQGFDEAVERIQREVIDKGLKDAKRAMSASTPDSWGRFAGFAITGATVSLAVFLGLPEVAAIAAAGGVVKAGIDAILEIRKDRNGRASQQLARDVPLTFIWHLRERSLTTRSKGRA